MIEILFNPMLLLNHNLIAFIYSSLYIYSSLFIYIHIRQRPTSSPPIWVLTQPGCSRTQRMPSCWSSTALQAVSMLSAACSQTRREVKDEAKCSSRTHVCFMECRGQLASYMLVSCLPLYLADAVRHHREAGVAVGSSRDASTQATDVQHRRLPAGHPRGAAGPGGSSEERQQLLEGRPTVGDTRFTGLKELLHTE